VICANCTSLQTWASSLNIPKFLENIDGVDTNDETVNNIIGKHEDDITTLPSDSAEFKAALSRSLVESAHAAVLRGTVLAVMIFAPVTPEQDICIDLDGKRIFVTADGLYRTINEAVGNVQLPIILLTPSPFTGGWLCRSMNPVMCPSSDQMMRIIAKSAGGAFANRFIRSFTGRNSPLITDSQRAGITYDDPMPIGPTTLQTDSLHRFQRQIHESLEHRLSVFARDHAFILRPESARDPSVFSDTWVDYGPRLGLRFERWAERWGSTRPTINHPPRFEFLGEAFGGTKESQLFHLFHLINTELQTNRGDWGRQVGGCTGELYARFSQLLMPTEDDAKRVFDALEFRASSAIVAQMVVKAFGLPVPDGFRCRYWHDKMDGVADEYYRRLQYAFGGAHGLFDQAAVLPSENQHDFKNVRFLRAARWLSAAIALRFQNGSREEIDEFVTRDVARFITKIQDAQKTLLLEDKDVTRAGLDWIFAIGLGGETPAAVKTANSGTDVAADPDGTDLIGQASTGSQLDVQAKFGPPSLAEKTQHQETLWTTSWTKFSEAEGSTSRGSMQQTDKKAPDHLDTQTTMGSSVNKAWGSGETASRAAKPEIESNVNDAFGSLKLATIVPDPPKFSFKHKGTGGEPGPSLNSNSMYNQQGPGNKDSSAWEKAITPSVQPSRISINTVASCETATSVPTSYGAIDSARTSYQTATSVSTSSFPGVDDNVSAWDAILNPLIASSSDQKKKRARVSFQESEDLLDLEEQSVDEPITPTWTEPAVNYLEQQTVDEPASAWTEHAARYLEGKSVDKPAMPAQLEPVAKCIDEPAAPAWTEPAAKDVKEKAVDEPATPARSESATKSSLQQALSRFAESLMSVSMNLGDISVGTDAEFIAGVFKKAAELLEEDKAATTSGSKIGSTAVGMSSLNSPASSGVNKDLGTRPKWLEAASWRSQKGNAEARTPSEGSVATPWRSGQGGTDKGKNKTVARVASEGAAATSSSFFDVSPEATGGHPRMGSLNVPMQPWARQNPAGLYASAMENTAGTRAAQASTDNTEGTRSATVQAATADNQLVDDSEDAVNLVCGNAFWARAGFKF
jgi:hypothetical protein